MRFAMAILALVLAIPVASAQEPKQILDYTSAYRLSQSGNKPMLVLVTATWCAPCQQMKNNTLPTLLSKDSFKNVHFAMVDLDAEPDVANALIGNRGVPQLVLFQKVEGSWVRSYVAGMQTPEGVEAFIAKANQVHIANATTGHEANSGTTSK
ncbi:MAG: thioredoxin family protein [Pirellulaceae bacterium]